MLWTDGRAYFAKALSYACNMFMNSTTGVNIIKLFSGPLTNKLVCLSLNFISG
jgi:hypothetical protein